MAFKGPYPTVFSGNTSATVIGATTFNGGVTNTGTIGSGGVTITSSTFRTGGFLNSKLISGATLGILVDSGSTIHGKIVNSGKNLAEAGIDVAGIVSGGIAVGAAGKVSAGVCDIVVASASSFSGGIANSGTLSANLFGIVALSVSRFAGGIANGRGGKIEASGVAHPTDAGIGVAEVATFPGGVRSAGIISTSGATSTAILASITDSGTISAAEVGIGAANILSFAAGSDQWWNDLGGISEHWNRACDRSKIASVSTFTGNLAVKSRHQLGFGCWP